VEANFIITPRDLEESSTSKRQLADFLCITYSRICQLLGKDERFCQRWRGDQYIRARAFLDMRKQRFADELRKDLINA
jgi:hypothetical protein